MNQERNLDVRLTKNQFILSGPEFQVLYQHGYTRLGEF